MRDQSTRPPTREAHVRYADGVPRLIGVWEKIEPPPSAEPTNLLELAAILDTTEREGVA